MEFRVIPVTPFAQNCTLLWCEETKKAAVVDPGGDLGSIQAMIAKNGLGVEKILLTHGHIDHVGGAAELAARLGVPIEGPQRQDAFWLDQLPSQCRLFGFPHVDALKPAHWLEQGDTVSVGDLMLQVLHTPGHTPGHVAFFHPRSRMAIVGDVLFAGSIGRTDFPRGDYDTLIRSIREKLWPLGDDVEFISGHGPLSTIGEERRCNPFVADGLVP